MKPKGSTGGFMEKIEFDAIVESLNECKRIGTFKRKESTVDFYTWNDIVLYHSREGFCVLICHLRPDINFILSHQNHANINFMVRDLSPQDWNTETMKINQLIDFDEEYYQSRIFWLYPHCFYILNKETLISTLGTIKDYLDNGTYKGDIDEEFFDYILPKVEEKIQDLKRRYSIDAKNSSIKFAEIKKDFQSFAPYYLGLLDRAINPLERTDVDLDIENPNVEIELEEAAERVLDKNVLLKISDSQTGNEIIFEKKGNFYSYRAHIHSQETVIDIIHEYSIKNDLPLDESLKIKFREKDKYYSILDADYLYDIGCVFKYNFEKDLWEPMNEFDIENAVRLISFLSILITDAFKQYLKPIKKHIILPKNKKD